MPRFDRTDWHALTTTIAVVAAALAASAVGVFVLEAGAHVRDASTLFLLAVALVAFLRGSWAAVAAAIGAFLTYNFLFVPPRFTFQVADSQHILTLVILLAVGVGIGRLTGLQRDHAQRSERREREARALYNVSRGIGSARRFRDALPGLVATLGAETRMERVWIALGTTWAQEQVVATTDPEANAPGAGPHSVLHRDPDSGQPTWVRLSPPGPPLSRHESVALYRVPLVDGEEAIGSVWAAREPRLGAPTAEETRLLAAAADQIGQAIVRDRLAEQATELEVRRRSDELKAALLDSVSHDLRTPLATIRATAGTLADGSVALAPEEARALAREIDSEADRLARLVRGLLDMSRIAGGALQSSPEPIPVAEIVMPAVQRARASFDRRPLELAISDDLASITVDPVLVSQVIDNLLENITRHTPPDTLVRISAQADGDLVVVRVEDGGPGVPPEAMPHLFEKFYRVPTQRGAARQGTGLGLAVVDGLARAMGGSVAASRSQLGGLAIDVRLPRAGEPPE
jgi:two-component system sensor histidine kinase KdpD